MTVLRVYKVLEDCKKAHSLLEEEIDEELFRIAWIAGVAILRAVGHVLYKVDRENNPKLRKAIDLKYAEWKRDEELNSIFWEFIEKERNNILKEYEIGFLSGEIPLLVESDKQTFVLKDNLFMPLADGKYAGEDCRDVLAEAITWWEKQLSEIVALGGSTPG